MKSVLILFAMIFCHIVDDYYLQGILASMKQKAWWQKQESYCEKYKYDYHSVYTSIKNIKKAKSKSTTAKTAAVRLCFVL